MKYGFVMPSGSPEQAVQMATALEDAGWDGFFVWEALYGFDAWMLLAAAAVRTQRIHLGTMISPISRMRPWKIASEVLTLDHLSGGRAILAVGLGALDVGFANFGEVTERKTRAELVDESLEIITRLWSGETFEFTGKHYQVKSSDFMPPPPPVQQPHPPIWVVGAWPSEKSMRRALRFQGLLPNMIGADGKAGAPAAPEDVRMLRAHITEKRGSAPYDLIVEGSTPGNDRTAAAAQVRPWAEAGATWWIEARWGSEESHEDLLKRIQQGPPHID